MSGRTFATALIFSFASGLYWWFVGQFFPFVVPMMLNDSGMLLRSLIITIGAFALYVIAAMVLFGWLLRKKRN